MCQQVESFVDFLGIQLPWDVINAKRNFLAWLEKKTMVDLKDYCGQKDNLTHREECKIILECTSKGDKQQFEKQYGTRYSCLLELPYFDPVRMTPIDPMHNLFLGTAKHMFKVWKTKGLIDDKKCKIIESRILPYSCPSDVGKLPKKISTAMGSFNADQLKNWTILFSIYALKGILPEEHLECWRKFILACRRLCSRYISFGNAKVADRLLIDFCRMFENLYGDQFVTPNMHLHGHLLDCILDYGPVYSFWLFSFERQNGILGSYKTNRKNVETQIMKRFLTESRARDKDEDIDPHFAQVFEELSGTVRERGTLGEVNCLQQASLIERSSLSFNVTDVPWDLSDGIFVQKPKSESLSDNDMRILSEFYNTLYNTDFVVCRSYQMAKEAYLHGSILGSRCSRSVRSSYVMGFWCDDDNGKIALENIDLSPTPGQIEKFLVHSIIVNGMTKCQYLAKVSWFKKLEDPIRHFYGKPVEVWSSNLYVPEGSASYIPIHRIKSRFVFVRTNLFNKDVMVISPRERYIL